MRTQPGMLSSKVSLEKKVLLSHQSVMMLYPGYSVRQNFQDPRKISWRKMQDSCKKYKFLAKIVKGISDLIKFLQDMCGSWNNSTFYKPF